MKSFVLDFKKLSKPSDVSKPNDTSNADKDVSASMTTSTSCSAVEKKLTKYPWMRYSNSLDAVFFCGPYILFVLQSCSGAVFYGFIVNEATGRL